MAQILLLKIDSTDAIPREFNSAADDITLNSFSIQGGGPVMSTTGIDLNNQDLSNSKNISFNNPTINTLGASTPVIINNLMAKERENLMTTAGGISFPVITNVAGEVDAFRLPQLAGIPTATPTSSGEGHIVWNSVNDKMYVWNGASWTDQSVVGAANAVQNTYTALVAISAAQAVYISASDSVSPASASAAATSYAIGFAAASALITAPVVVQSAGVLAGFTGLTAGSRYYLGTTAGSVVASPPTGTGNTVILMGLAKNTTNMHISVQNLGRRA